MSTARPTPRRRGKSAASSASAAPLTEPFFWKGDRIGCLLVHGLTSSPYEMRFLGEQLHDAGHTVYGVRLAGHGTRPEDLEQSGWRDWCRSAEEGLEDLAEHCSPLVVVGLSLGSLIGLCLARNHPKQVSALALLSPALVLRNPWVARLGGLARLVWPILPSGTGYWAKGDSDIADPRARRRHPAYRRMPLRSIAELDRAQREARSLLPDVLQPVLAIQGRQDHAITLENLAILQRDLPHLWGTVILPASYHVITVDLEKDRVAEEIIRFIGQVVGQPSSRRRRGRTKG